jgi:hypothetical protein
MHDIIGNIIEGLSLRFTRSGPFSWTNSTPLGDSFKFVENVRFFLSAPEQVASAPSYMGSNFIRHVGVEDTCVPQ